MALSTIADTLQSSNPAFPRLTTFRFLPSHLVFQPPTFARSVPFVQILCSVIYEGLKFFFYLCPSFCQRTCVLMRTFLYSYFRAVVLAALHSSMMVHSSFVKFMYIRETTFVNRRLILPSRVKFLYLQIGCLVQKHSL